MNEKDDLIVLSCRKVIESYEAYVTAKEEHDEWVQNEPDNTWIDPSARIGYESGELSLRETRDYREEIYQDDLKALKVCIGC